MTGKPLTDEEILSYFSGQTIKGTTFLDRDFIAEFASDGTVKIRLVDTNKKPLGKIRPKSDKGRWWVSEGKFCRKLYQWLNGETGCAEIVKEGNTFKFYLRGKFVSQAIIISKN